MRKASRNFLSLFVSDGITRIIGFAATIYIARVLAVEGFGLINYGLAFISYALLFANPGLTIIGTREVARAPHDRRLIEATLGLRLVLGILMFAVFFVGSIVIPGDTTTKRVIIVYALTLFPFAVLLEFVFQGREEMGYIGAGRIIQYGIYLVVLLLFLRRVTDLLVVPLAFVISYLGNAAFLTAVFISKYGSFKFRFSLPQWRTMLSASVPVGLAIIFNHATISLPPIVLGIFMTNYEVGVFSAGWKIVFVLLIIERVFYYVFFPILSRQHKEHPEQLAGSFNLLIRLLFGLTIPIAVGGLILAPGIIVGVFGRSFLEAAGVLRILLPFFVIAPVNTVFGYGLIAIGQEKQFFRIISMTALLSAIFIVLLGCRFGAQGAAGALFIGECVSFVLMSRELGKSVPLTILKHVPRPLIAGLAMAVVLFCLQQWHFIVLVIFGAAAYAILMFLLRGFSAQSIRNLYKAVAED